MLSFTKLVLRFIRSNSAVHCTTSSHLVLAIFNSDTHMLINTTKVYIWHITPANRVRESQSKRMMIMIFIRDMMMSCLQDVLFSLKTIPISLPLFTFDRAANSQVGKEQHHLLETSITPLHVTLLCVYTHTHMPVWLQSRRSRSTSRQ